MKASESYDAMAGWREAKSGTRRHFMTGERREGHALTEYCFFFSLFPWSKLPLSNCLGFLMVLHGSIGGVHLP